MRHLAVCAGLLGLLLVSASPAVAGSYTFTNDVDWDLGLLNSVNHNANPPDTNNTPPGSDQLQLDPNTLTPFNFIWVAASGRGTAVRIDTDTGAVLGEYLTAPNGRARNPSRTTVDLNGDVWIGNRDEAAGGLGSIVHISASATGPNTSTGLGDIRAWTNGGGVDSGGGTSTAADDAIMHYVRTTGTNVRAVAVDANNDVWVGGFGNQAFQKYDGATGAAEAGALNAFDVNRGGYGALIDGNGVLWSAGFSTFVRYDPATGLTNNVYTGRTAYGLGVDNDGDIWLSNWTDNSVQQLDSNGVLQGTYATGTSGNRGVAVTPSDNNVWVASSSSNRVVRLNQLGVVVASIPVGVTPTGVSVDSNGKVWVTNYGSNNVMRIDPATNAVDLTVSLGAGANPYNYSDMTGSVLLGTTNPQGSWRYVKDSGVLGMTWDQIFWNTEAEGFIPTGGSITIEARASDTLAGLLGETWVSYASGAGLGVTGQYLELRATLRPDAQGASPILSDLMVTYASGPTGAAVPLPSSLALFGMGGLTLLLGRVMRRRRRAL